MTAPAPPCPASVAAAAAPTLWLVRHAPVQPPSGLAASAAGGASGLCYGRSDWPAHAAASQAAAQALAAWLPPGTAVRASPLQRCALLARQLQALRPDAACTFDPRLAEMDFGAWEGRPWAHIPRAEMDAWLACFADHPPGGGETLRTFMARVAAAWDDWRASSRPALWITHAGVMRAALLLSRGIRLPAQAADWPAQPLPFGQPLPLHAPPAA